MTLQELNQQASGIMDFMEPKKTLNNHNATQTIEQGNTIISQDENFYERKALVYSCRQNWKKVNGYCSILDKRAIYKMFKTQTNDKAKKKIQPNVVNIQSILIKDFKNFQKNKIELKTGIHLKKYFNNNNNSKEKKSREVQATYLEVNKKPIHKTNSKDTKKRKRKNFGCYEKSIRDLAIIGRKAKGQNQSKLQLTIHIKGIQNLGTDSSMATPILNKKK